MARARNIKPGLFHNEELAELPMSDRLLFIGLWTLADCDGILEDRTKRIKAQVFPYDDVDVDAGLDRLAAAGFVTRYVAGGDELIFIPTFTKHQSPHKNEKSSGFARPDAVSGAVPEDSQSVRVQLAESSQSARSSCAPTESPKRNEESISPSPPTPSTRAAMRPGAASTVLLPLIEDRMPRIAPDFSALHPQLSVTWLRQSLGVAEAEMDGGAGELAAQDVLAALGVANDAISHALRTATDDFPIRNPPAFARDQVVTALCDRLNDVRDQRTRPAVPAHDPMPAPISRPMPDSVRRAGELLERQRHAHRTPTTDGVEHVGVDRPGPEQRGGDAGAGGDPGPRGFGGSGLGSRRPAAILGPPAMHGLRPLHRDAVSGARQC